MRAEILAAIVAERAKAEAKHGKMTKDLLRATALLQEEVGEYQREVNDLTRINGNGQSGGLEQTVHELVQVASTAIMILDNLIDERLKEMKDAKANTGHSGSTVGK